MLKHHHNTETELPAVAPPVALFVVSSTWNTQIKFKFINVPKEQIDLQQVLVVKTWTNITKQQHNMGQYSIARARLMQAIKEEELKRI